MQGIFMIIRLRLFGNHYSETPVVFCGWLARHAKHTGNRLTDFLGDLKHIAHKEYPEESKDFCDHLCREFIPLISG